MSDPSNSLLAALSGHLRTMAAARVRPATVDEALRRLKDEGHITKKVTKRPMARVRGRVGVPQSGAGQAALLTNPVSAVFKGCEALGAIREAAKGSKTQGGAKHGLGHAERLLLASVLRRLPGGPEAIHKLLGGCSDYDQTVTNYHMNSLQYGPWRCVTAQEYGVCLHEGTCPAIRKRGGKSPVAFAHRKAAPRRQKGVELRSPVADTVSTEELENKVQAILKRTSEE